MIFEVGDGAGHGGLGCLVLLLGPARSRAVRGQHALDALLGRVGLEVRAERLVGGPLVRSLLRLGLGEGVGLGRLGLLLRRTRAVLEVTLGAGQGGLGLFPGLKRALYFTVEGFAVEGAGSLQVEAELLNRALASSRRAASSWRSLLASVCSDHLARRYSRR